MDESLSKRNNAIMAKRMAATRGKINRHFGPRSPISEPLQKLIKRNHNSILGSTYLDNELRGYKRILDALRERPEEPGVKELLQKLNADPLKRRQPAILCPIWRHDRAHQLAYISFLRYMFPAVYEQCFFLTIIFDYAPDLETLEDRIPEYRAKLDEVERRMSQGSRGLMMFGTLEPDLRSYHQITTGRELSIAHRDLGWDVQPAGGWVTSSHIVGRAVQIQELRTILNEVFPSEGWARVRLETFRQTAASNDKKRKALLENALDTAGYLFKHPKWLAEKGLTKGPRKPEHERWLRELRSAFHGSTLPPEEFARVFDLKAATRQWATFVDRLGPELLCFSVENAYAQKWYSASETQLFTNRGEYERLHGYSIIEVHRDFPLHGTSGGTTEVTLNSPKRRRPYRRRRALRYDEEWLQTTDVSDVQHWSGPIVEVP